MRTTPTILLLALSTSACYQYFPVYDTEPLPTAGAEVRIRLDERRTLDLGTMTINDISTVEGHVRQSESDNLSVFSNELRTFYGFRHRTNGAVFDFDRSELGLVSRASPVQTAVRNCTRDEGGPFGFGDQVADPKPPQAAVVKSHGGERCGNAGTMIPAGTVERGERKRTVSEVSKAD